MSARIDMSNNRANIAYVAASKGAIWHGLGHEIADNESMEDAIIAGGLNFTVVKVPLWANIAEFGLKGADGQLLRGMKLDGKAALARHDTGAVLGIAHDGGRYNLVQPRQGMEFLYEYVGVDERWKIDTLGSLDGGGKIWALASFQDEMTVGGDRHKPRLLLTTSFDGTMSTIAKATMVCVVCANTLAAAVAKGGEKSEVRIRHSTRFDAQRAARDLSKIIQGYAAYKAMGDAMEKTLMAKDEISNYFKAILDIPFTSEKKDISTRKLNQFDSLRDAYSTTVLEGRKPGTQWSALNAVTRYVDHSKSTRGGGNEARVLSAEFGSGAAMKARAVQLLIGTNGETIEQEIDADVPPVAPVSGGNLSAVLGQMGF